MKHVLPFQSCKFTLLPVVLVIAVMLSAQADADNLRIIRSNGHEVSGDLDIGTNEHKLWIKKKSPRIILKSSFDWHDVKSMVYQNRKISRAELLKQSKQQTSKEAEQREMLRFWFPKDGQETVPEVANNQVNSEPISRVAALQIDAYVANWDSDAETDGLILHLTPVDRQGQMVAVNGQVNFKLIGERYNRGVSRSRNDEIIFPELGSWNKQIRKQDFGPEGATIKLEFRKFHPEVDINLAATALLTGSFGIPGQGKFHASVADVVIRPTSKIRDELQLRSKKRSRFHHKEYIRSR